MESHNSLTALKATQPAAPGPFATPRPQSTCWHHLHVLTDKGASCTQQGELSFSCQSLLLIAAHRTALVSCYVDQFRIGFPFFSWDTLLCSEHPAAEVQPEFYITAGILTLPPLMAPVAQGRTICLLSFGSGPMTRLLISDLQVSRSDPQWDLIPRPPHSWIL